MGDVTSQSALLWLRTNGPMVVQVEWAPVAAWDVVSKMATAVAPVARSPLFTTGSETDFTLAVPLEGLTPATRYRLYVSVGTKGREGTSTEARVAARGEFTTLADAKSHVPVTVAWSGDLGGQGRCRRGAAGYPIFDVMRAQQLDFFCFSAIRCTATACVRLLRTNREPTFSRRLWPSIVRVIATNEVRKLCGGFWRPLQSMPYGTTMKCGITLQGLLKARCRLGVRHCASIGRSRVAADDPQRLYRTVRAGADLEVFILDTRQYRSRNAEQDGPAKTMLGEQQLQWLLSGLTESTATWKVIVTTCATVHSEGRRRKRPRERWLGWRAGRHRIRAGAAGDCGPHSRPEGEERGVPGRRCSLCAGECV